MQSFTRISSLQVTASPFAKDAEKVYHTPIIDIEIRPKPGFNRPSSEGTLDNRKIGTFQNLFFSLPVHHNGRILSALLLSTCQNGTFLRCGCIRMCIDDCAQDDWEFLDQLPECEIVMI